MKRCGEPTPNGICGGTVGLLGRCHSCRVFVARWRYRISRRAA